MSNRRILISIAILIFYFPQFLSASESYVVSGYVKDKYQSPIEFATVTATDANIAAACSHSGFYSISLPEGIHTLKVQAFGFNTESKEIFINRDTTCNFALAENAVDLKGVNVYGKSEGLQLSEGALSVNAIELNADVNRLTNLNDLVGRSAGVKVRRDGGAGSDLDLSINGLSGNSIRYFIDGIPLDSRGSQVNLDNIPLNTVERVEIYKGVVPAHLSSDALGGVVNIVTKRKRDNYLDASYGVGSFHTHSADLTGQTLIPKTAVTIRPTFSLGSSKNDYKMKGVEIWSEEDDKYIITDKKRFHDDYLSLTAQLEAGVTNVKWADIFFISGGFTKIDKEIQTGAMQNKVYGKAAKHSYAWNVAARYAKKWDNVAARINLSHTWDHSETVDTAFRKYSWDGTWLPSSGNEMNNRARTWRVYRRPLTVLNAGIDYTFINHHSLSLYYMLNRRGNEQTDKANHLFEPTNDVITKHILSLSYTHTFFDERLQNMFFLKDYINSTSIRQTDNSTITGSDKVKPDATKSYWGAGAGTRFSVNNAVSFKASFEHSVRLPLSRELLGNGTTVMPNLTLNPEESNNFNLGMFGTWIADDDHILSYDVNGFIRHVGNYIRATVSEREGYMQYVNEPAIDIKGMDFDLNYFWRNALGINLNGSWNDARNLRKYKTDGNPSATYKNRVPNRPWLYANAEVSYTFQNLSSLKDKLRIGINHEWIHWYFLNWEAYGSVSSKAKIPTQNITSASAAYSWLNNRYNLSIECHNIFDRPAYDNYMLQKPGRAIYFKFRIFIQ